MWLVTFLRANQKRLRYDRESQRKFGIKKKKQQKNTRKTNDSDLNDEKNVDLICLLSVGTPIAWSHPFASYSRANRSSLVMSVRSEKEKEMIVVKYIKCNFFGMRMLVRSEDADEEEGH